MSACIPSRTPHRSHPHTRTYARAWRMAAALAPPAGATPLPAALVALGVALLVVTLALLPVGVLLEVPAYLHRLDTGTYTVPLVGTVVPALVAPAFLLACARRSPASPCKEAPCRRL